MIGPLAAIHRVWRGEIGLYRAAYALGGVGVALLAFIGDGILDLTASAGGMIGWLVFIGVALGELAFAWLAVVATWRAARCPRNDGARYGLIAIGIALAFVGLQFILTAAWIGWAGLSGLGLVADPAALLGLS